jgi:hypothetical protein
MSIKKGELNRSEVILFERKIYLVPSSPYMELKSGNQKRLPYVWEIREHWMVEEASKTEQPTKQYEALRPFMGLLINTGESELNGQIIKDLDLLGRISAAILEDKI